MLKDAIHQRFVAIITEEGIIELLTSAIVSLNCDFYLIGAAIDLVARLNSVWLKWNTGIDVRENRRCFHLRGTIGIVLQERSYSLLTYSSEAADCNGCDHIVLYILDQIHC